MSMLLVLFWTKKKAFRIQKDQNKISNISGLNKQESPMVKDLNRQPNFHSLRV
jgi:hypothetical protein